MGRTMDLAKRMAHISNRVVGADHQIRSAKAQHARSLVAAMVSHIEEINRHAQDIVNSSACGCEDGCDRCEEQMAEANIAYGDAYILARHALFSLSQAIDGINDASASMQTVGSDKSEYTADCPF